ncbi:MAG: tetratricopeptide repeat protein [bacterium]
MRLFLPGLLLMCMAIFSGCGFDQPKSDQDNGSDSAAITLVRLNEDIEKDRKNPDLYNQRSKFYLNDLEFDKALKDINTAISLNEKNPAFYITLSDIQLFLGQSQSCMDALNQALSLDPADDEARLKLAKLYLILKNHSRTFQVLNEMIKQDEYNPKAYFLRAIALLEKGDTTRAVGDLMKAADQDQQYFEAYLQLGELFSLSNDPLAEGYMTNALRIKPASKEALYMLGMYYQNTGQYDKAFITYDRLSKAAPDFRNAPYNKGYIYLVYLNDFPKAIDAFTNAIRIDSGYVDAWFNRGYAFELNGQLKEAYKDYQKTLGLDVNNERAIEGLNRLDKSALRK